MGLFCTLFCPFISILNSIAFSRFSPIFQMIFTILVSNVIYERGSCVYRHHAHKYRLVRVPIFFCINVGTKNVSRIFLLNLPVRLLLFFPLSALFSLVCKNVCVFLGESRTILCESNSNSRLGRLRNCLSIDVFGVAECVYTAIAHF